MAIDLAIEEGRQDGNANLDDERGDSDESGDSCKYDSAAVEQCDGSTNALTDTVRGAARRRPFHFRYLIRNTPPEAVSTRLEKNLPLCLEERATGVVDQTCDDAWYLLGVEPPTSRSAKEHPPHPRKIRDFVENMEDLLTREDREVIEFTYHLNLKRLKLLSRIRAGIWVAELYRSSELLADVLWGASIASHDNKLGAAQDISTKLVIKPVSLEDWCCPRYCEEEDGAFGADFFSAFTGRHAYFDSATMVSMFFDGVASHLFPECSSDYGETLRKNHIYEILHGYAGGPMPRPPT